MTNINKPVMVMVPIAEDEYEFFRSEFMDMDKGDYEDVGKSLSVFVNVAYKKALSRAGFKRKRKSKRKRKA